MSGKRWLLAGVVALAGACTSAPVLAVAATPPSTQLTNPGCHRAMLPSARKIAITGVMRPVSRTNSMEMMFDLQRSKHRAGPFSSVHGRGLDRWVHPPNSTLGQRAGDIWKFDQKVSNLAGTAYYRFRVRFRWLGSNGHSLGTVEDVSPVCYQPELRADLIVRSLAATPVSGGPTQDRYVAWIGNRGATGAGPFQVTLAVPSAPTQSATVGWVRPHSRVREVFTGPACTPGDQLTVTADPSGTVLDYNRANNTLNTPCPAATTTARRSRR
jgi:CARDB